GRDVAGPIHAGDGERRDQLVAKRSVRRANNLAYRVLYLPNKGNLSRSSGGQPPEFAQEPIIGGLDSRYPERFGHVVALGFLDIEADPLDPLLDIEIEHLA